MKGVKGILLMAGKGERFDSETPKQFHLMHGRPIYQWTLEALESTHLFDEIILVSSDEEVDNIQKKTRHRVVAGGKTRQESSYFGLMACGPTDIVLIHDGVRPFVSEEILRENIKQARIHGAVDTCIRSTDTLVYSEDGNSITSIPNRSYYLRGQTPQTFSYDLILAAHQQTRTKDATDDCQLVLELGKKVVIVQGSEENRKITTKVDLQKNRDSFAQR